MQEKFGITWWGNQWLNSLKYIDYANRIPRGTRYARNGSVFNLKIKEGTISARVKGNYRSSYGVNISVKQFTSLEKDILMQEILKNSNIISKLLSMELDPELLNIAKKCKIKIFPDSWKDFFMRCTCPDIAIPCKHIAAVIYKVSQEIDNNPFLVFKLHGLDIIEELKNRGISSNTQDIIKPITYNDLLLASKTKKLNQLSLFPSIAELPNLKDSLISLLPPSPAFYSGGDFRLLYSNVIQRVGKVASKILVGGNNDTDYNNLKEIQAIKIRMNSTMDYSICLTFNDNSEKIINPDINFLNALLGIEQEDISNYNSSVEQLRLSAQLAMGLISYGDIIPQIVSVPPRLYAIRWIGSQINTSVAEQINRLENCLNDVNLTICKKTKETIILRKAEWIVSMWINLMIKSFSNTDQSINLLKLMFGGEALSFKNTGEKNIPLSIKAWTDRFFIEKSKWRVVFIIKDNWEKNEKNKFGLHLAFEDIKNIGEEAVPLKDILRLSKYESSRITILKQLSFFSSLVPLLNEYINTGAENEVLFNDKDFATFVFNVSPIISLLQARIILPKSLKNIINPKVTVKLSVNKDVKKTFLRLDNLLQFNWEIALGDKIVSQEEFYKLVKKAENFVKFKEQYIYVSANDLVKIKESLLKSRPLTSSQMLQVALSGEYKSSKVVITPEVKTLIEKLTSEVEIKEPKGLIAKLRPYQQRGYSWMYKNMKIGFGSIIADDMGLGKTLQVITLLQKLKEENLFSEGKAIIVVPTGLLINWQNELKKFTPNLNMFIYHGLMRNIEDFTSEKYDLLITSYGIMRSDVDLLKQITWSVMVIDEAQNIKNYNTAQSKALHSISATTKIAMSGTPIENKLSEYWSIMEYTNKGLLNSLKSFNEEFGKPIQIYGDEKVAERFKKITSPFMMRRLKSDKSIISDLPDKIERNEYITMTQNQAALYQETVRKGLESISSIEEDDNKSLFKRSALVLQMIMALKQICNHPSQFLKDGNQDPSLSGKTEVLLDLVRSITDSGEKVIIFTQFREMGEMLKKFIEQSVGLNAMFLHGGCSVTQRQQMVERFQNNRTDKIFILSLKAAGTGLNLTAATNVIHYDLWWNPAVEAQATDRAYRIGQHSNVQVYRFITSGTFEEKIDKIIQEKKHLADMTISTGENWIGKLSNKELSEIFS